MKPIYATATQISDYYEDSAVLNDVLSKISSSLKFDVAVEGEHQAVITLLDGYRTPLNHENQVLLHVSDATQCHIGLMSAEESLATQTIPWKVANTPKFYWDFDPKTMKEIRSVVKSSLGYWSIQPRIAYVATTRQWRILDKRRKTVVRVTACELASDSVNSLRGGCYVTCSPVRGFDAAYKKVNEIFGRYSLHQRTMLEDFQQALELTASQEYAAKALIKWDEDAYVASTKLLKGALNEMRSHTLGLVDDVDTEFLHQYRVNLRKTRSLLKECKAIYANEDLSRFNALFRKLSSLTTPVRDYDVHILMIEAWLRENQETEISNEIIPLLKLIERKRKRALKKLITFLKSEDYLSELEEWDYFLQQGLTDVKKHVGYHIGRHSSKRIRRCYRRLIIDGHKLNESSADEEFHDLRLDFKRLRYLLEYFKPVYPQKKFAQIYKRAKKLQSVLGDFQDITVQKAALMAYTPELESLKEVSPKTFMCLGYLLQEMGENHDGLRQQFHELFAGLDVPENEQFMAFLGK